jgi:hypothetical protein
MGISRKRILTKIAGNKKAIEFHLSQHIPALIGTAHRGLVEYWRKEVNRLISEMEDWSRRLSKNEAFLAECVEYRKCLNEILDQRLRDLD